MTPKEISLRILEIAPEHGLPKFRLRPRSQVLRARISARVRRLGSPEQEKLCVCGDDLLVPEGRYWNPPPPHVVIHELAHAEQRQRQGRMLYQWRYCGLAVLHVLTLPVMLLPILASMVSPSVAVARALLLVLLAAEMLALAFHAPLSALAAAGLLAVGYAPFGAPVRAQMEFEACIIDALFVSWSEDMAWDPRVIQRYGSLQAHRLRWIHDTVTGPSTHWAVTRPHGKRMLSELAFEPEKLLLKYPKVFAAWRQVHKEYVISKRERLLLRGRQP